MILCTLAITLSRAYLASQRFSCPSVLSERPALRTLLECLLFGDPLWVWAATWRVIITQVQPIVVPTLLTNVVEVFAHFSRRCLLYVSSVHMSIVSYTQEVYSIVSVMWNYADLPSSLELRR